MSLARVLFLLALLAPPLAAASLTPAEPGAAPALPTDPTSARLAFAAVLAVVLRTALEVLKRQSALTSERARRAVPLVASGLGVVLALVDRLAMGATWTQAVIVACAGPLAVFANELVDVVRKWPRPPTALALLLAALLPVAVAGCRASPQVVAATATIATVQSIGAGVDAFSNWAVGEERAIMDEVLATCRAAPTRPAYYECANGIRGPRRERIDRVRDAIRVYRSALAIGGDVANGDVARLGADVIAALATVGIRVEVR